MLAAFADLSGCPFDQPWLPARSPRFRPAAARAGWWPDALVVLGELSDDDVFNPIERFNDPAFQHGDVFELFLRPENQDPYFEFHVSPTNQQFQLRIPSGEQFRSAGRRNVNVMKDWLIPQPVFQSYTQVLPDQKLWRVLAIVPFAVVMENKTFAPGCRWKFSFSRYDYTRGIKEPVLSSTSPHVRADYHRQEEWGTLIFEA